MTDILSTIGAINGTTTDTEREFDSIQISLAGPTPSNHGRTVKLKKPKPSTIAPLSLSAMVYFVPKSLDLSKILNACAASTSAVNSKALFVKNVALR